MAVNKFLEQKRRNYRNNGKLERFEWRFQRLIIIYINTINKRKQIGILKAVGINQGAIIHSYVIQALFYCFSGIIIGAFLLYFLTSYMTANPISFPMGDLKPVVEQQLIIQSIISLIAVSFIAGLIPSWKTVRENILKAIWG